MPAVVTSVPLGISCVFSDGSRAAFTLSDPPCPRLARDLLDGLAGLIHPHGTVDAAGTAGAYVLGLKLMTRALAGRGFTGGAGQLTRAMTAEYLMGAGPKWEGYARGLLRGLASAGQGRLAPGVSELAAGRAFNVSGGRRPLDPYSETEWARLITACQRVIEDAYARHKEGLRAAGRGADPRGGGWTAGNTCWLLARIGPCGRARAAAHLGVPERAIPSGVFPLAHQMLFPHTGEVIAYQLLFGAYSGIVPDGVAGLRAGGIDWAGDAAILLSYIKGRSGPESVNLPRQAVRLLEQWLSHSALLRQFLPDGQRDRLWARLPTRESVEAATGRIGTGPVIKWVIRHQVTADDGSRLKIHRHRIRTTHHAMRDRRAWTGSDRATIDPNHGPHVEGDHYLTAATPAQRHHVDTIIEDAQHDLVRRAHPPAVIDAGDATALVRDFPYLVSGLGLPAGGGMLAELTGGQRDVFAAACADQLSGLHGPRGKPCPARPWVCLACPLAVFAPRHAPNLLRLRAFFARQWQAMPSAQFMAVFGLYARRVDEILERFAPAVVDAAAGHVTGDDGELPLRPEERT
jgi:hypothetical protein